jgi:uncharacterized alpha-E superfamily protein
MLSRVADAMFWMSRYLERAEVVARLLDVNSGLDLDLHGVVSHSHNLQWTAVVNVVQSASPPAGNNGRPLADIIAESLTFDMANPGSIASCVNRSRNNARSIRGTISSDMWRELNKLYWQLWDPDFRNRVKDSPHDLYQTVEIGSHMFQGVCDATMPHDEGWQFIQLGKNLEKAEKTLRLLDARYQQLHGRHDPSELSLLNLHWGSVLKCCLAFQAYQHLYISRVEPERVVEFLLFNTEFPHSVCFCLQAATDALAAISQGDKTRDKAAKILGRAVSELHYPEQEGTGEGWKPLLDATLQRCMNASAAIQEQYFLI